MARWPDFLIIGAAKCGTTSLHRYLDQHPRIRMLPDREVGFFSRQWRDAEADGGDALTAAKAQYTARFDGAPRDAVVGECSNAYLWHRNVPERIHAACPDARLVLVVRDPVARAHSHYLMNIRNGRETRSLEDAMRAGLDDAGAPPRDHVQAGFYGRHLAAYLEHFPLEQIHIMHFADLLTDPRGALRDLCHHLGVDADAVDGIDTARHHNPARMPRGRLAHRMRQSRIVRGAGQVLPLPVRRFIGERILLRREEKAPMPEDVRRMLAVAYAPDVERLESLTGRRFDDLRRSWPERF